MALDDEIRRAERAKAILGDELVIEAFAELEQTRFEAWRKSPVRDTEGREQLWHMLKAAESFRTFFEACVENGKMAAHKAEQAKRDAENESR